MIEYVIGTKTKPAGIEHFLGEMRRLDLTEGTLYVGYPVLTSLAEPLTFDALLTSIGHGVIIFDILTTPATDLDAPAWAEIERRQEAIYSG
jgi:hypothetical protein